MSRNVILLGIISFLNDISSEMILAVLPLFLLELGGGGLALGFAGGGRELLSNLLNIFSGYVSDKLRTRKEFVTAGYGISTFFKFLMGISPACGPLIVSSILERIGKGIRTAPRDALLSFSKNVGRGFGFHRAMDTSGALIGSLTALYLVNASVPLRKIVIGGAFLALIAVLPSFFLEEPEKTGKKEGKKGKSPFSFTAFTAVAFLFSLSRLSYMFLVASARKLTESSVLPVAMYAVFNLSYAVFSYPAGFLSERIGSGKLLSSGYILFGISLSFMIFTAETGWLAWAVFFLFGTATAVIDTVERVIVADLSSGEKRGSAYGLFHGITGTGVMAGNAIAGYLWNKGWSIPFLLCGAVSVLSGLILFKLAGAERR